MAAELGRLRPTSALPSSSSWSASTDLRADLGVDSIEVVALAAALTESLHLHESGIEDRLLVRATIDHWASVAQAGLESFSASLTFRTSGSTGEPASFTHSLDALWQEAATLATRFADRERVMSAVRSHHIYGFLFTVLLPRALDLAAERVVDVRDRLPSSMRGGFASGDVVIGYPELWRAIADAPGDLAAGVMGVTSTAPCPNEVADALARAGLSALVQIYGSTETAGVGLRSDPSESFALLPFWRRAEGGVDLVRTGPDGRTTVKSPPDSLVWRDDRHFLPVGRVDHAVQIAGVNVFPSRVRRVLMEHPDVSDAAVRPMREGASGRLKAFIVPRPGCASGAALHAQLDDWAARRLSAPERPRAFSFGGAIPKDASGKLTDWPLPVSERAPEDEAP